MLIDICCLRRILCAPKFGELFFFCSSYLLKQYKYSIGRLSDIILWFENEPMIWVGQNWAFQICWLSFNWVQSAKSARFWVTFRVDRSTKKPVRWIYTQTFAVYRHNKKKKKRQQNLFRTNNMGHRAEYEQRQNKIITNDSQFICIFFLPVFHWRSHYFWTILHSTQVFYRWSSYQSIVNDTRFSISLIRLLC